MGTSSRRKGVVGNDTCDCRYSDAETRRGPASSTADLNVECGVECGA